MGAVLTEFRPTYPIRCARLVLRPHTIADLDDLLVFHSDPEVVRYLPWPVRDRRQTTAALQQRLSQDRLTMPGQWLVLAVEHEGAVIGEVLLKWHSEDHRQGEIGFALARSAHGRGLGAEAATAMLGVGFDQFGLHRIVGVCDTRNIASAHLLARLGMRREGHFHEDMLFKGQWSDTYVYAITAREWAARTQQT